MQTPIFVRSTRSIFGPAVAVAVLLGAGPLGRAATKADLNATPLTQALYTNLRALQASNSTAFGEQFGTWQGLNADGSAWQGDFNRSDIQAMTGSHPAMTGWNIQTYLGLSPANQATFVQRVKDDFNRNTIIGFHWTMNNPITGGPDTDTTGVGQTPSVLARAVTVGDPVNANLKATLDSFAALLAQLTQNGAPIPIIFRPFHEMEGTGKWWQGGNPGEYAALWNYVQSYLRDTKGIHQLLYAYAPSGSKVIATPTQATYLTYWPGDQSVDICGGDLYEPGWNIFGNIIWQVAQAKNMVAAFCELGPKNGLYGMPAHWWTTNVLADFNLASNPLWAKFAYMMTWTSTSPTSYFVPYPGNPNVADFLNFVSDPHVLLQPSLPPMYVVAPLFAITTPPVSQTVKAGASATFTVAVSGTAPTYQWNFNGMPIGGATAASYTIGSASPANAGSYTVTLNGGGAALTSPGALLAVQATGAPAITAQPQPQTMAAGATVTFTAGASGTASYQWYCNGVALHAATNPTLLVPNVSATNAGSYACLVANASGSALSSAAALTVVATNDLGRLTNLSVLTDISASVPNFTVGTVIGGAGSSGTKPLVVRADGPSLAAFGVPGTIPDPQLNLFSGQTAIASNDNWGTPAYAGAATATALLTAMANVGAFPFASPSSKDAAVFAPGFGLGPYTVVVSGVGGATGTALAEIYDATPSGTFAPTSPRLINVSVLKAIASGGSLTLGFTIGGSTAKTVLIRVIGPGLAGLGLTSGTLGDPQLALNSTSGSPTVIATNDDWGADPQLVSVIAQVGAFPIGTAPTKDAMLLVTLPAGGYTAVATGNGGTSGTALVEVYEVP